MLSQNENNLQLKQKKLYIKNCYCNFNLSLGLHKGRLSYRLFQKRTPPEHYKTLNFLTFFIFLWIIFVLLDTDPD